MEPAYKLYSSVPSPARFRAWAEVDLSSLRFNYRLLRKIVLSSSPSSRLISVVKAEAYGHGSPACVRALLQEGCDYFAVSSLEEALSVRSVCDSAGSRADILILGYTDPSLAPELSRFDLIQSLLSEEYALSLSRFAVSSSVTVRSHVALDTGMNRIGFPAQSGSEIASSASSIARVCSLSGLSVEGMFTHFSRADEAPLGDSKAFTELQSSRYRAVCSRLSSLGVSIPFHHVCNSAASLCRPSDHFDGVRLGILLYGARVSDAFSSSEAVCRSLRPVMKLKAVISHLHVLHPGEPLGYGGTFSAPDAREIATLPIGYGDGFLRAYSGATVIVHTRSGDKPAAVVGQICMDQCMLDVTGLGASIGDEVTLFGSDPGMLSACADRALTIDYESLCLISARVPRVYKDDEDFPIPGKQ